MKSKRNYVCSKIESTSIGCFFRMHDMRKRLSLHSLRNGLIRSLLFAMLSMVSFPPTLPVGHDMWLILFLGCQLWMDLRVIQQNFNMDSKYEITRTYVCSQHQSVVFVRTHDMRKRLSLNFLNNDLICSSLFAMVSMHGDTLLSFCSSH